MEKPTKEPVREAESPAVSPKKVGEPKSKPDNLLDLLEMDTTPAPAPVQVNKVTDNFNHNA